MRRAPSTSKTIASDQQDGNGSPVQVTLFMSKIGQTETVSMVAYENGTYDILRDGKSISPHPWPADDLDACIDAFRHVARPG